MDLDWLETLLAVVDRGGFTAAAATLHRSQSRVSGHIAALERDLGVRLFDRSRRPTALTPAGEVFLRYARDVVGTIGSARAALGGVPEVEPQVLTLVTTPAIGAALFAGVLTRMAGEARDVHTRLTEHDDRDAVRRQVADGAAMAVLPVVAAGSMEGLEQQVRWKERLAVVVNRRHPLATHRGPVPVDRLAGDPQLAWLTGPDDHPAALRVLRPRVTVDSPHVLVELARAGGAAAILGDVALHQVDLADLVALPIAENTAVRAVAAYWSAALLRTEAGRRLQAAVLEAPLPPGAQPAGVPDEALRICPLRGRGGPAAQR